MADQEMTPGEMLRQRQKATLEAIEAAGGTISNKPGEGLEQVGVGAAETPYAGTKPAQATEETKPEPLHPVAAGLLPRFQRIFTQQGHSLTKPTPETSQEIRRYLEWQLANPTV